MLWDSFLGKLTVCSLLSNSKTHIYLTSESLQKSCIVPCTRWFFHLKTVQLISHKYAVTGQSPWVDTYHWNTISEFWVCCRCYRTFKIMSSNEHPMGGYGNTDVLLKLRIVEITHEVTSNKNSYNHLWKVKHESARTDCFKRQEFNDPKSSESGTVLFLSM